LCHSLVGSEIFGAFIAAKTEAKDVGHKINIGWEGAKAARSYFGFAQ